METIIASNKWSRTISGARYGETSRLLIEVEAELVKREGNQYPYFTITGTIKKTDKRYRDPVIACGAIHEEILRYFPHLAPLVEVHLRLAVLHHYVQPDQSAVEFFVAHHDAHAHQVVGNLRIVHRD